MSMLRSGMASLIRDFGTCQLITVLPGAMCCGKSHGAKMLSSIAAILVMTHIYIV